MAKVLKFPIEFKTINGVRTPVKWEEIGITDTPRKSKINQHIKQNVAKDKYGKPNEKTEGKEQKVEKAKEYTVTIGNENIVFSTDNSQTFEQWSGERTVERQMQEQALRNKKYQEELEGLRTERRKSIESLINSSKTSQEKYDTFIRNIRKNRRNIY